MISFKKFIKLKEGIQYSNPRNNRKFSDRPNIDVIYSYMKEAFRKNINYDPITSFKNMAASATDQGDDFSRGSEPANWKFLRIIQSFGFNTADSFYDWFYNRNGKNVILDIEHKIAKEIAFEEEERLNNLELPGDRDYHRKHRVVRHF